MKRENKNKPTNQPTRGFGKSSARWRHVEFYRWLLVSLREAKGPGGLWGACGSSWGCTSAEKGFFCTYERLGRTETWIYLTQVCRMEAVCVCVTRCMGECALIFKFCTVWEKWASSQKRLLPWLCWCFFSSGLFYCCYYYFVGTEFFFSLLLLTSKTSNASETHTYQEERGTDSLTCISWVSSFLLRGAFGRLFYFNWQCGFFLALHRRSLWPAWGLRSQANLTCKKLSFCCLFICFPFVFVASVIHLKSRLVNIVQIPSNPPRYSFPTPPWDSLVAFSS